MNKTPQDLLTLIGRILLALMFVSAGYSKIGGFDGTVGYIASAGLPLPNIVAVLTIALEIGAGIALIVGYKARYAAFALAGFTLLTNLFFHNFWAMPADKQMVQMLFFWKNAAVVGGMLMVAAFGPGGWSVDGRRSG
jgi:putative oxidoreductase